MTESIFAPSGVLSFRCITLSQPDSRSGDTDVDHPPPRSYANFCLTAHCCLTIIKTGDGLYSSDHLNGASGLVLRDRETQEEWIMD